MRFWLTMVLFGSLSCADVPERASAPQNTKVESDTIPFVSPMGLPHCPIRMEPDGYWVPTADVHKEGCACYRIRAKLNGEDGSGCLDGPQQKGLL